MWRRSPDGSVQVLIVHRAAYDDWSLPKGKLDPDESHLEAALREVAEETGLRCTPGEELPEVRYLDSSERSKRVRYWAMTPASGAFTPNGEVDEVRWVSLAEVADLLTYPRDAELLAGLWVPAG